MAEPLAIDIQATPNPNAAKFTLNRVVAARGTTYRLPEAPAAQAEDPAAVQPEWATRLLGIVGVTQVFALQTFITVNKRPDGDWNAIAPQVERVLQQAFS